MTAPWNAALDSQYAALKMQRDTRRLTELLPPEHEARKTAEDLKWETAVDMVYLSLAETYSWIDPAREAVLRASATIPTDSPLHFDQLPGTATGWWHFAPPLPVLTIDSPIRGVTALLWGVFTPATPEHLSMLHVSHKDCLKEAGKPVLTSTQRRELSNGALLMVSAYHVDESGEIWPSTKFYWQLGDTLDEMLTKTRAQYRKAYGVGGRFEHAPHAKGEEHTMHAVNGLARFFLAGCIWLGQEILVEAPQHIERHARKRYVRENKLKEPPTLKLIALRHVKHGGPVAERILADANAKREWSYQWTVGGHWRNQPFGPGRIGRRTIYINPFIKGPEDKPMKPDTKKVYVVMK